MFTFQSDLYNYAHGGRIVSAQASWQEIHYSTNRYENNEMHRWHYFVT